jgi:hypothetical protein
MTTSRRATLPLTLAIAACVAAPPATAASPSYTSAKIAPLVARTGACPRGVTVLMTARRYEGGGAFTIVIRLAGIAGPLVTTVRRGSRTLLFSGPLRSAYASCSGTATMTDEGSTYRFAFAGGRLRAAFEPAGALQRTHVDVRRGDPTITAEVAD